MKREIERRFLVRGEGWKSAPATFYRQGYLHADPGCTVRVRLAGEQAWITIKGRTTGAARDEYEYEIPVADVEGLLALAHVGQVEKWRRVVIFQGARWEVDEFVGANAGLVLAEIELDDERQAVVFPDWLGEEVTHNPHYSNACLAARPYSTWGAETHVTSS